VSLDRYVAPVGADAPGGEVGKDDLQALVMSGDPVDAAVLERFVCG
jgi:hypothetical protein